MEKEKRWEELEKKYKELVEEIDREFPEAYLDISVAFMGTTGAYLTECFLCKDYGTDRRKYKIHDLV